MTQSHVVNNSGEQPVTAAGNIVAHSPPEYLTKTEVAKRLNKTERTIDAWMRQRYLPYLKIGKTVLFHWPTVQEYLSRNYAVNGQATPPRRIRTPQCSVNQMEGQNTGKSSI